MSGPITSNVFNSLIDGVNNSHGHDQGHVFSAVICLRHCDAAGDHVQAGRAATQFHTTRLQFFGQRGKQLVDCFTMNQQRLCGIANTRTLALAVDGDVDRHRLVG